KGLRDTPGPHSALSTCRPLRDAVTSVMCQAGTVLPLWSLRWPVSISWFIRTRTTAPLPDTWARMRIGSAMWCSRSPSAAAAQGDLHFLLREPGLVVGGDRHREHVRG